MGTFAEPVGRVKWSNDSKRYGISEREEMTLQNVQSPEAFRAAEVEKGGG
jgi:hypothetical protein